jgi:hypothetical protein
LHYGEITGLIIGALHYGLRIMGKTGRKPQPLRDSSGRELPSFMSETDKLPKGQSYPLKPMKLAEALSAEGISIDVHLVRGPGVRFDVYFWPPRPGIPHDRLYVCTGTVHSEQAADARQKIESTTLPAMATWLANLLKEDPRSPNRQQEQWFDLSPR